MASIAAGEDESEVSGPSVDSRNLLRLQVMNSTKLI